MSSSSSSSFSCPKNCFVFASPAFEEYAEQFGSVNKISRKTFPNGEPCILIPKIEEINKARGGANVLFFWQYNDLAEKKMEELILYVLADTANVKRLIAITPYDPSATMERVLKEGEVATANVDAHWWKSLPTTDYGNKVVRIIYDHHTLQNRFYFSGGNTRVVFRSALPLFKQLMEGSEHKWSPERDDVAIAFPDAGACKRFGGVFNGYHVITCGKQRVGDQRVVTIQEGNPKGKRVVIVDDLVRSGGTLIECAKKLVGEGATEISAFVTHGEFPCDSWKKFLPDVCPVKFHRFYITDSCPTTVSKVKNTLPFHVISLVEEIKNELEILFSS
mmetsp:Transcript_17500/g.26035  ORF Transcript_17500/g.26035 Transcript_17500/m.26035 type:complete len:333 (-) Transcript_17500:125-1123(-)